VCDDCLLALPGDCGALDHHLRTEARAESIPPLAYAIIAASRLHLHER
jgi:hypothetical protein